MVHGSVQSLFLRFQTFLRQLQFTLDGHTIPQLAAVDSSPPETEEEQVEREEEQYPGE